MCQILARVLHAGHGVLECGRVDTRKYCGTVKGQLSLFAISCIDSDDLILHF